MTDNLTPAKIVWQPLPGSQAAAISCPCNELLYEGSRGPGKTDCQVMAFRRYVGKGYGKHWRGVIFDRQYSSLDDLIAKSKLWFPQFKDGAKFLSSKGDLKWVWPNGEELLFRQITKEADYSKYHGHQYPFIGWNELTKFANPKVYDLMKSCNRSGFLPEEHTPFTYAIDGSKIWLTEDGKILPNIPLFIFATTNPIGPGHAWVKKRFIDVAEPGEIVKEVTNVFNPRTQQREDIVRTQVRLFGSYKENKYLDPVYVASLENEKDENRRKAWLHGDWNIVAGGALDDLWKPSVHVIPRFDIPKNWLVDRAFDWGSTHPASVGWYAEANGEEIKLSNGEIFAPRRGSIIRFNEWYLAKRDAVNEGLKMSGGDIASGILEREMEMLKKKWVLTVPIAGPADNQIFQNPQSDVKSIGDKMAEIGVKWTKSDKSNGSRVNGLQLIRDRLEASIRGEGPGIYFTDNCKHAISLLPVLPRDPDKPDDVDTLAEDHLYDEVRYRVLDSSRKMLGGLKTNYAH
ncbi:MAG: terminase family protein [Bombella sp.]|nr:terminase family protein [Bombella sp.]